ncbi:MAG: AMP-binding protein [Gammaproteobacteria bacterium]|nr:AMP-binding protein [Gammaproteobacteria bacterium]
MNETESQNAYAIFRSRFQGRGDFIRAPDGSLLLGYSDLDAASASWARRFAGLGLCPGDRVIVQVEKSPENLLVYFACLRAGYIYLPVNTAYLAGEIAWFCEDAEPALAICDPAFIDRFDAAACPVLTLDAGGKGTASPEEPGEFGIVDRSSDDTAIILYTSGTTGRPKGAMITHRNLVANGLTLYDAWQWQSDDVLLHALPIFHIHGLMVATHLAVLGGSPIIFLPRFDPDAVINALPGATVYMGVPTNYVRLLADARFDRETCRNMRLFTSGSAPLLVPTFEEFTARTGHRIVERYGMTETGMNTSNPLDGERRPGTVGRPLPGVETRLEGEPGQPGVLMVRGENVFKGYWRMPEKTRDEFDADGFFRTGDIATVDEDGYVTIVGRDKDMIISGGLNVYPKEIETVIDAIDGVRESAVIGIPHADFGEAVAAVVVRDAASDEDIKESDIIATLKSRLANFKVPKRVFFIDELPRNAMGKVQKAGLREQYAEALA